MEFIINIDTSFKNKPITIYDIVNNITKEILELKLRPFSTSKIFYRFLLLQDQNEFPFNCEVPKNKDVTLQIKCTGNNITDTESEYFETETNDIIIIDEEKYDIINKISIKNPYKQDDNIPITSDEINEESISKGLKIGLIVGGCVVVVLIGGLIFYFCYFKKNNPNPNPN